MAEDTTSNGEAIAGIRDENIDAGLGTEVPAFIEIPAPSTISYKDIKNSKTRVVDPIRFAKRLGEFNRGESQKNYDLSKNLALQTLDTELAGLEKFAPAAAALKRSQTSADNVFNQLQRDQQVDSTMPGAREALNAQGARAETWASGRAPDDVTDRALEMGVRSAAADRASAGGFGAASSVARKSSDLMSAEQRINLSRYGESLLSANLNQRSQLLMAPTSYSDAGSQIRVSPEVGAGRVAQSISANLDNQTIIPVSTSYGALIQQRQFNTNLRQATRQFNASNRLQADSFNASAENQFKLTDFQYQTGYAAAVASAANQDTSNAMAMWQQETYGQIYNDSKGETQDANTVGSIAQGVATVAGAVGSLSGLMSATGSTGAANTSGGSSNGSGGYGAGTGTDNSVLADPMGSGTSTSREIPGGTVSSSNNIPSGSTGIMSNADGSVTSVPTASLDSQVRSFSADTSLQVGGNEGTTSSLLKGSALNLNTAGVSYAPQTGYVPAGVDRSGARVYVNSDLATNDDISLGEQFVGVTKNVLSPTGALTDESMGTMERVAGASSDVAFLSNLTALQQQGDAKGFINTLASRMGPAVINNIDASQETKGDLTAAFDAHKIYSTWDRLSGAQKSIALASFGVKNLKVTGADGTTKNLADVEIPATQTGKGPALTVGAAVGLLNSGVNSYSLVKDWDQLSTLGKVVGGINTAADVVRIAKQFNTIGAGVNGAEVGISAQKLASSGYTAAPHLGVGAQIGPVTNVPEGYTVVTELGKGEAVIAPTGTASTAQGAVSPNMSKAPAPATEGFDAGRMVAGANTVVSGINAYQSYKEGNKDQAALSGASALASGAQAAGVSGAAAVASPLMVAQGAYNTYKNWGEGGARGRTAGAIGGSMMMAGTIMMVGGPAGWIVGGALLATAVIGGSIKTGKHADQNDRDSIRESWQKNNFLVDKEFNVSLADGSKFNIGMDGHSGEHDVTDASRLTQAIGKGNSTGRLHSYDCDYTNDLDFVSNMGGVSLSRLVTGGISHSGDQIGGQLGNAALSSVGYNQKFTQENFTKTMANHRAMYAQAGIGSKADAYQLANKAFAEGRLNETETIATHQAINMIFDDDAKGWSTAQKLMSGRTKGLEVAEDEKDVPARETVDIKTHKASQQGNSLGTFELRTDAPNGTLQSIAANAGAIPAAGSRVGNAVASSALTPTSGAGSKYFGDTSLNVARNTSSMQQGLNKAKTNYMPTRDEIAARNKQMYGA